MKINLQTRKISEVPYGGVFIANNDDVSMSFQPNEFDAYIKVEESGSFIKLSDWEVLPLKIYWSLSQAEIVFTGIVLPLRRIRRIKEQEYENRMENR